jgi:predicted nuclease of predicted toxin-antitoxin system
VITFFIDRALGKKSVPEALKSVGAIVEIHADHFVPDSPDVDWLPVVAQRGWVVLTKDVNIGRRHLEVIAIAQHRAKVFVLNSGNLKSKEMADIFVEVLPKLVIFSQNHEPPFIVKINRNGIISMWKKSEELLKQIPQTS